MSGIPGLRRRFRFPWRTAGRIGREVDDELGFHLDMLAQELADAGIPPEEARAEARRRFGDLEFTRRYLRGQGLRFERATRRADLLDELRQDLRYAARQLRRNPTFAAVSVVTLALGIGATTAIFGVVYGVLLRPLAYADAERVVVAWQHNRRTGAERDEVAPANFLDWHDRSRSFERLVAVEPYGLDYAGPDGPESLGTWLVTDDFFRVFRTPARLGRTFLPEEYGAGGRSHVVVLSDEMWRGRFGADPGIVGRTLTLDREPWTVVGVMPPAFEIPTGHMMWAPKVWRGDERQSRVSNYYTVLGRLRPGVTLAAARAELAGIAEQLAREHPRTNAMTGVTLVPLPEQLLGRVRPALLVLLGAVGFVLLIACANVANLFLARALRREHELAIRAALGAARSRVVRQLLTEGALLAALGGAAGVLLAHWMVGAVVALSPADLPRASEIRVDGGVLAFAAGLSVATALLFALVPALRAAAPDLQAALKAGGRPGHAAAGRARSALRGTLVAGEVALSLVLLAGAGLLVRSLAVLLGQERGFRTDHVLTVTVQAWQFFETPARRAEFVRQALERLRALPGVRAAGMTSSLPLAESIGAQRGTLTVEGRPVSDSAQLPVVHIEATTPGYFEALRIALRRGRMLGAGDDARAPSVALINETLARRFFPEEDPLGKRITVSLRSAGREAREVVGVVADVRHDGLHEEAPPSVFLPHAQSPTGAIAFVVRTAGDPLALLRAVRREIGAFDAAMPVSGATTLDALLARSLRERRFHLALLAAFALAALALSGVGIYGVMSQATGERVREIGIRVALGARPGDVLALVMRDAARLTLAGIAAGLAAAALLTRVLRGMLYGVTPLDATTFAAVVALVVAAAAAACLAPARRAVRVDPALALRAE